MPDITLRWVAPSDADATTDYRVESDGTVSGTFNTVTTANSSTDGGNYPALATTLRDRIRADADALVLSDGTGWVSGDYAVIDREFALLANVSGNDASGVVGGQGSTLTELHDAGAGVYKAHESYTHSSVDFLGRHAIRYRVVRVQGSNESIAAETIAFDPSPPPSGDYTTLYGVVIDSGGSAVTGVSVQLDIQAQSATLTATGDHPYGTGSGGRFSRQSQTVVTDDDGYYEFFVPKSVAAAQDTAFVVTIGSGTTYEDVLKVTSVPDVQTINVLETL